MHKLLPNLQQPNPNKTIKSTGLKDPNTQQKESGSDEFKTHLAQPKGETELSERQNVDTPSSQQTSDAEPSKDSETFMFVGEGASLHSDIFETEAPILLTPQVPIEPASPQMNVIHTAQAESLIQPEADLPEAELIVDSRAESKSARSVFQVPTIQASKQSNTSTFDPNQSSLGPLPADGGGSSTVTESAISLTHGTQTENMQSGNIQSGNGQIGKSSSEIGRAIADRITETLIRETPPVDSVEFKKITLKLHPAELGKLTLQVGWENDTVRAHIIATEFVASELLNRDKNLLLDTLSANGLEFGSLDIRYGGPDQDPGNADEQTAPNSQDNDQSGKAEEESRRPRSSDQVLSEQGSVINVLA